MKQKLFTHDKEAECQYCKHGKPVPSGAEIICVHKGITPPDGACRKFKYDPLKRQPKIRQLQEFSEEDFTLDVLDEEMNAENEKKAAPNKIANIINFVRSVEPRAEDDAYLYTTLEKELQLCDAYDFPSTVLLQYDALIKPEYPELISKHPLAETGLWLEVVAPLAEKAGIRWNGRYIWDWKVNCGCLTAYNREQREQLIDAAFSEFKKIYGNYPKVVGAWMIDAYSLYYLKNRYGIVAACICKEQFGTDGITLWGGYYNGAYYPSDKNTLCPASCKQNQIDVPVFRMLGPDPIYQYDMGLGKPDKEQQVCTLEPVYPSAGADPEWVRWYLAENFNNKCLSHAYAQFGQENSFGWDKIGKGLTNQLEILRGEFNKGHIDVITLSEAGERFRDMFDLTPETAMCTDSDFRNEGNRSVWYYSRFYRINVLSNNGNVKIRDLQIFDDRYPEQYLDSVCKSDKAGQFNLPVMDGFRFSKGETVAGIIPVGVKPANMLSAAVNNEIIATSGTLSFDMYPEKMVIRNKEDGWKLKFVTADVKYLPYRDVTPKKLYMEFKGFADEEYEYSLKLGKGKFKEEDGAIYIEPENNEITMLFN